ncbi:MAG: hypothetical protein U9R37_03855 [Campylobacterota bacterium]|nr:hypothetical protein [Campylobacterota bacterium]
MNAISVLVISISNPILVGIYKDGILIEEISQDGKTSDILPLIFKEILNKYNLKNIYYVNEPGSYMSIKISYIFLKTLSIVKNINFKSINGFEFNNNSPIKALGKKYFFNNKNGDIVIDFLKESDIIELFKLPNSIEDFDFKDCVLPKYNLPVV